ncbi:glycosyltransferase family 2 protein [Francisella marina]|uniref:Glycosyltransferase family 2 protein n=1 Tax=Francisella marina TaxID=2249302 RepID=A0ABX5ZFI1_9GAMM|nr:glycosyltransferase family 2 protein [Francisella marina]QEO57200.1 glycosyltransferase family 2 protein [Francisella marina]QEO58685.1 glycosyltransferase family 2 protein [Francisella marina]
MLSLISIIVPVYNTEKYLYRCLFSIVNQTYKNLEIILVNDGSTDNSLKICNSFAASDSRIVVVDKANHGSSAARNIGLEIFRGEYVAFVDSDDWVSLDYIETLYTNIKKYDADISLVSFVRCDNNYYYGGTNSVEPVETIYQGVDIVKGYLQGNIFLIACASLVSSKFLSNLKFQENIVFEDVEIFSKIYDLANKVVKSSLVKYFYFSRGDSHSETMYKEFNSNHLKSFKKVYQVRHKRLLAKYPELEKLIFEAILRPALGHYATNSHDNSNIDKLLYLYKIYYRAARKKNIKISIKYVLFFYFPNLIARIYLFMKKLRKTLNAKRITKE